MTAKYLIQIARQRLGDVKDHRWTDARLLQIVNQGQADICKLTGIYRKEAYIELGNDMTRYVLPSDCMTLKRIEYQGNVIPLFNRNDIDAGKQGTQEFVCLKDNLSMGFIETYPALEDITQSFEFIEGESADTIFTLDTPWGVVVAIDDPYDVEPDFGVITYMTTVDNPDTIPTIFGEVVDTPLHTNDVSIDINPEFGVTVAMANEYVTDEGYFGFVTDSKSYNVVGQYGLVASIAKVENIMKIYYDAVPTNLTHETTLLVIPDIWEIAMVRYIVGTALQDDNDANNIQRGEMELTKYANELAKARELGSKDFSSGSKEKYHTRFRRV